MNITEDQKNRLIIAPILVITAIISLIVIIGSSLGGHWIVPVLLLPLPISIFYALGKAYKNNKFKLLGN